MKPRLYIDITRRNLVVTPMQAAEGYRKPQATVTLPLTRRGTKIARILAKNPDARYHLEVR